MNPSPEYRATQSVPRANFFKSFPKSESSSFPTGCPCRSLSALKLSMSSTMTESLCPYRLAFSISASRLLSKWRLL